MLGVVSIIMFMDCMIEVGIERRFCSMYVFMYVRSGLSCGVQNCSRNLTKCVDEMCVRGPPPSWKCAFACWRQIKEN